MPFLSFFTKYHICKFEEEKYFNEGRFTSAWITYFLRAMFAASESSEEVSYEEWSKGLGITPFKKKRKFDKAKEAKKGNDVMSMFLGKGAERVKDV